MADSDEITRRRLLVAGAGGALTLGGAGAFAERTALKREYRHLTGACGEAGATPPDSGARVERGTLRTEHLPGGRTDYRIALPAGFRDGQEPGLLVFLHGRGGSAADAVDILHLPDVASQARSPDTGDDGLVVASVTGGESYWHPRADGRDPLAMLLDEFLPLVAERIGTGGGRVAMGVSMGGYGAALAAMRRPRAFAGVVVSSGAIWTSREEQRSAVPDAFDSDADYATHDVIAGARRGAFRTIPVRVDCGTADGFLPGNRAFAAAVPAKATRFDKGCHESRTWRRYASAQLTFARLALRRDPFSS